MADIQLPASGRGRRKLATPRIDLTPMVDLGFLLITFFMYTTTMATPMVMELQMPYTPPPAASPTTVPAEATIVLIPAAAHRIAFYRGTDQPAQKLEWRGFAGKDNLRALLVQERARVKALPSTFSAEAHKLHVLIKPDTSAAYEDIVRILDEMAIGEVPYYTLMRITPDEQAAVQLHASARYGN